MVGAHVPVRKVWSLRRDGCSMIMSLLAGMVTVGGKPYPGEVSQGPTVRDYVRTLNIRLYIISAIEQELRDLRGDYRANATSSA